MHVPAMLRIALILLLSVSNQLVYGLICATNCSFTTQFDNIIIPSCNVVNKSSTQQSCQIELSINYTSGSIVGHLEAQQSSLPFQLYLVSSFSLYDDTSYLLIGLDCSTTDNCDQEFLKETLNIQWLRMQNYAKNIRETLAGSLFNASDLRPNDTCAKDQPCTADGFCTVQYRLNMDGTTLMFSSKCANSMNQPELHWSQIYSEESSFEELYYTCNTPFSRNQTFAQAIVEVIKINYVVPVNVTIPPITTTTKLSSISGVTDKTALTPSTSTFESTSEKNTAVSVDVKKNHKIIFGLFSVFLLYIF